MGRDDEWIQDGEWIRGDEWVSGGAGRRIGYGETTVAPGVAWTTVWGAEAEGDAEDEADEDDWPGDNWPGDNWPGDDPGGWGHGGIPGFSARMAVAVAVVAAAAGVAVGFLLTREAPVASAAGRAMPGVTAPTSAPPSVPPSTGSGAGPAALPRLPGNAGGNGDEHLRMLLTGRVLAVSRTSVTIGGAGPSVTASVTSTTRLTGRVHGPSGVKVGDEVAAQISGTPSHLAITALQDPVQ
ncbi:MAG TPA: hypothetical protein VFV73_26875 [Streptosporangiaceae bacterium]|nr:hypothetical protein [Streptosporangiaceae bacterium]